ncbi:hypothetical protein OG21DRAFT_1486098 [Imleria badia]|nr:hypothetical protein OG21DRAFT_1486098 [Imleria badia]
MADPVSCSDHPALKQPYTLGPLVQTTTITPLEDFFAQFASLNLGFSYREDSTAHNNFNRLRRVFQWGNNSTELLAARVDFHDALALQFNFIFGTDSDLGAWQNLCSVIDITPVPDVIDECKRLVWDAHVNIVDLLETARTGERVRKFANLEELRRYTQNPKKRFPKKTAYAGGLLKELLREIFNPYLGRRRNGSEKKKRRKARKRAAAMQSS